MDLSDWKSRNMIRVLYRFVIHTLVYLVHSSVKSHESSQCAWLLTDCSRISKFTFSPSVLNFARAKDRFYCIFLMVDLFRKSWIEKMKISSRRCLLFFFAHKLSSSTVIFAVNEKSNSSLVIASFYCSFISSFANQLFLNFHNNSIFWNENFHSNLTNTVKLRIMPNSLIMDILFPLVLVIHSYSITPSQ